MKSKGPKTPPYQFLTYSLESLAALHTEIETKYEGFTKPEHMVKWYIDKGALNKFGAVIVKNYRVEDGVSKCDYPTEYLILQNKLEQYYKKFGKTKAELEELVKKYKPDFINQMQIDKKGNLPTRAHEYIINPKYQDPKYNKKFKKD